MLNKYQKALVGVLENQCNALISALYELDFVESDLDKQETVEYCQFIEGVHGIISNELETLINSIVQLASDSSNK